MIDYNEGPDKSIYKFRLHFDGDQMIFEIPGLGSFQASQAPP
jgi:hypothetical protein